MGQFVQIVRLDEQGNETRILVEIQAKNVPENNPGKSFFKYDCQNIPLSSMEK